VCVPDLVPPPGTRGAFTPDAVCLGFKKRKGADMPSAVYVPEVLVQQIHLRGHWAEEIPTAVLAVPKGWRCPWPGTSTGDW
jgi:hypothetical protein